MILAEEHLTYLLFRKRKMAYEQVNQMLIMIETTKSYEKKLENAFEIQQRGGGV